MRFSDLLTYVTQLGDQGVILPFVVSVAFVLVAAGARREALYWCAAIFAALFGSLLAKIVFIPCGHLLSGLDIRSPSGHTAASVAAYGGFAVLSAKFARDHSMRALLVGAASAGIVGIAISRFMLGMHSVPEVLLGGLIGLSAPAILYRAEPPASEPKPRPAPWLLLLPIALAILLHGASLPVEDRIAAFAARFMSALGICG